MLNLFKIYGTVLVHYLRHPGLFDFTFFDLALSLKFKPLNVFSLPAATKNWKKERPYFVKPTPFFIR